MPDNNRQVKSNAASNQSADNIEEAIWRLKIHDPKEKGGIAQSGPYPDRPGEPDCLYYLRTGVCGYGSNCRFNHPLYSAQGTQYREELPERVGQPDCGYYLKTGTCKYGSTCKFHHPRDRNGAGPVSFNMLGLPMRQDEKPCPFYMRTGACKFGVACKFNHPQHASFGASFPTTAPAVSSPAPSSGLPYVGGLPTWSLPRAPYMSGPQTYMPIVVSPSQGVVAAQGWNTYLGNMNPVASASILGPNLIYDSRNQGESGSGGQAHLLSTSSPNLPERPDQPECRYFMNTGTCKYGVDCKYHHPKERIAQLVTNTVGVGPIGLPSRPGQAVCSAYSIYGICKFGPTCRFDHPYSGYSYAYSLSPPPFSVLEPSLAAYPRTSPASLSLEDPLSHSSKGFDWTPNPDGANKKQHQNARISDHAPEQVDSPPPHSSQASSEPSHD